jgi:tRNA-(ms[2]io[6]A)-hydroxylase
VNVHVEKGQLADLLTQKPHQARLTTTSMTHQNTRHIRIEAQMHGGGHERGFRSGTLATHQIVGMGECFKIAKEEMEHFGMVHDKMLERGMKLGFERKDPYVNDLSDYLKQRNLGGNLDAQFVNRMMFAAMIEARSCERFRILSEEINDADLRAFYRSLMESEARHYTTFLNFARKYGKGINVEKHWQEFLDFEATLMAKYGTKETMHG